MSIFGQDSQYGNLERREMHSYIPGSAQVVLDVGCHTGYFGKSLKNERRCVVWGIEVNQESAEIARRHLDHVIIGYFSDELIPNNAFDVIVFNDVLEHIADPTLTLRLALTKLKKGGCIVASLPNLRHIDNLEHIIFDKDFRYETNGIRDKTHLRFYTKKSIPRLFESGGFDINVLEGINQSWWSPSIARRLLFRLFPSFFFDTRFMQYAVVATPKNTSL